MLDDELIRRQRRAVRNMPSLNACTSCGLSYYQTSAPHVCAGWTTKGNRTMNESEKFITTGVFSHERNTSGNCSVSGCPCRGWSAQESVNEHEHEPVARGGEGEWWADSSGGWGYIWQGGACLAKCPEPSRAEQIVTEHNQRHSLLAEREKLRTIARDALRFREEMNGRCDHDQAMTKLCTQCEIRAALNDQKGE